MENALKFELSFSFDLFCGLGEIKFRKIEMESSLIQVWKLKIV